ncbi:MAG: hypothetical protein R8N24_01415 [Alphaproteobacteria bacterium]|nr:hypothetical protein [Alphaproteobacteria bacterium]
MKKTPLLRKTKQVNKTRVLFLCALPLIIAVTLFILVYHIQTTIFWNLDGMYLCPMDYGPGSAHDACVDAIVKRLPYDKFVIYTMPSLVCGMIGFAISVPKIIKHHKLLRWLVILIALFIGGYFIIKDYAYIQGVVCEHYFDLCY